jgi:phosphatidylinositol alpha-1,6-mannosyltransferase
MNFPRVLCITNDFGPRAGGIETFVIGLIERLPKNSVVVYTSRQADSLPFDEKWRREYGVEVIRDRSTVLLPTLRVGRAVRKIATEQHIQHVFFGAAAPLALLSQGLRRAGVTRIVALTHGHEVWWSKIWPFSFMMHRIGEGVDHLTYLGEFTRSHIARALSLKAQGAMVKIAPGIDINHFSPTQTMVRTELGLNSKKVIVCVGRLVHRKGQDLLVEAMPEVLKSVPDAHLLFVGTGPREAHLRKRVTALSISDAVTFIGRVHYQDLPRFICAGDIFAMPARSRLAGLEVEGLGIVYLEASACGLAVVGGNSGGAPDAVIDNETGLIVDGTSVSAVAQACAALLQNPDRARAMGERGRQWITEEWQWDRWATAFARLLTGDQISSPR